MSALNLLAGLLDLRSAIPMTSISLEWLFYGLFLRHPLRFSKDSQGLAREEHVREATGRIAGAGS
jgi:hypothetical protein